MGRRKGGVANTLGEALSQRGWVVTETGCWEYSGTVHNHKGYREIYWRGETYLAHRAAYLAWVSSDLGDLHVLHACDNPPCINPEHLRAGTNAENVGDRIERKRTGFKLTPETALEIYESPLPGYAIAEQYGIGQTTVSNIKHKRVWKHIHEGG